MYAEVARRGDGGRAWTMGKLHCGPAGGPARPAEPRLHAAASEKRCGNVVSSVIVALTRASGPVAPVSAVGRASQPGQTWQAAFAQGRDRLRLPVTQGVTPSLPSRKEGTAARGGGPSH